MGVIATKRAQSVMHPAAIGHPGHVLVTVTLGTMAACANYNAIVIVKEMVLMYVRKTPAVVSSDVRMGGMETDAIKIAQSSAH